MSKKLLSFLAIALLAGVFLANAMAKEEKLVFICHPGLNYSEAEVTYAFKAYLDEPRPVDNRRLFSAMLKHIGYTEEKYKRIWAKMYFRRALFTPKMMESDKEVIDWVANSYGGLGYVSEAPRGNAAVEVCGTTK